MSIQYMREISGDRNVSRCPLYQTENGSQRVPSGNQENKKAHKNVVVFSYSALVIFSRSCARFVLVPAPGAPVCHGGWFWRVILVFHGNPRKLIFFIGTRWNANDVKNKLA